MVLDTSLYKVLSWSFMGLIRSEITALELEYKKLFSIAFMRRKQTIYGLIA